MGNTAWERWKASMPSEEDTKRRAAERASALKAKIAKADEEYAAQKEASDTANRSMFELPSIGVGTYAPSSVAQAAASVGPQVTSAASEKIKEKVASAESKSGTESKPIPEEQLQELPNFQLTPPGPRVVGYTQPQWVPTTISETEAGRTVDPKLLARGQALQRSGAKAGMEATALSYEAAKAAREAAGAGEELKQSALETAAQQREDRVAEMDKVMQRRMGALMTMFDDIDSGKVDVEKHWGTRKDTWAIIGMLVLTMAAGGNPMDVIRGYDDRIRSKIDEEQAELERASKLGLAKVALGDNLLNMTMQIFNNTEEARAAAEALRFKALDSQLTKAMLMATSAQDKANLAAAKEALAFKIDEKVQKVSEATAGSYQRTAGQKFVPPQPIMSAAPSRTGNKDADGLIGEFYDGLQQRGANDAYADLDAVLNAIPDEGIRDKVATMIGSGKYGDAAGLIGQFFHSNPNALAAATEYMNSYIHQMTGAQMGVQEVGRYFAAAGNMTPQGFANFVTRRGSRLDDISDQVASKMSHMGTNPNRGIVARHLYNIQRHNARVMRKRSGNFGRSLPASSGDVKRMSP